MNNKHRQVKNRNLQPKNKFQFFVDRLPDFNHFIQRVSIPALNINSAEQQTPLSKIYHQGDHIQFNDLVAEFKVSEGMRNWYEIFSWMVAIGFPQSFEQYATLKKGQLENLDDEKRDPLPNVPPIGHIYGQAKLFCNTSHNNAHLIINFVDVYPISLSELEFNYTAENTEEMTATVTFRYDYYTVEKP
jgi:hypothetical protein